MKSASAEKSFFDLDGFDAANPGAGEAGEGKAVASVEVEGRADAGASAAAGRLVGAVASAETGGKTAAAASVGRAGAVE